AVVERRDLAEQLARGGMAKAQLAPLLGGDRQADAAFGDDVEAPARVAAAEHQLALAEARFPASRRAGRQRLLAEAAEQVGRGQQPDENVLGRHVSPAPLVPPI